MANGVRVVEAATQRCNGLNNDMCTGSAAPSEPLADSAAAPASADGPAEPGQGAAEAPDTTIGAAGLQTREIGWTDGHGWGDHWSDARHRASPSRWWWTHRERASGSHSPGAHRCEEVSPPVTKRPRRDVPRQICKHWLEYTCAAGSRCQFAHVRV